MLCDRLLFRHLLSSMEGSIMGKITKSSKATKDEEQQVLKPNKMWRCVSLYREHFEVELGRNKRPEEVGKDKIRVKIVELISQEIGKDNEKWTHDLFEFLFRTRRIGSCVDSYTSPFLGPSTKRISYVIEKHNVFYDSPQIPPGRYKLNAIGRTTTIDGTPVRATIRLLIAVKEWGDEQVEDIRAQGYDWFCGTLE
nr:M [Tomato yellow mottle-associated virus] [Tomato yellow mottle-associated virus]